MDHIRVSDVPALLRATDGHIFSVEFVKRSTGECRIMQCRFGVTSYLQGGEQAYRPADHKLLCVFDVQKKAYRSIALEGLRTIHAGGKAFIVDHVDLV